MLTALKLLATAGLGALYLALAYAGAHPRVSAEYRDHYLQRTADCWLPGAMREAGAVLPAEVEIGRLGYPEACLYLRSNWWPVEDWGAWIHPGPGILRLPWQPGASAVELRLRGPATRPRPGPRCAAGQRGAGRSDAGAPGEERTVRVALPPAPDRHAWEVRLQSDGAGTAATGDPNWPRRNVGFGLVRLRYLDGLGG